jgi:hypothetical protein
MVNHTTNKLYWQILSRYDQQYNAKMATIWKKEKKEKLIIIYMYIQIWQPEVYKNMTIGYSITTQLSFFFKYINYTVHNLIMPPEY